MSNLYLPPSVQRQMHSRIQMDRARLMPYHKRDDPEAKRITGKLQNFDRDTFAVFNQKRQCLEVWNKVDGKDNFIFDLPQERSEREMAMGVLLMRLSRMREETGEQLVERVQAANDKKEADQEKVVDAEVEASFAYRKDRIQAELDGRAVRYTEADADAGEASRWV